MTSTVVPARWHSNTMPPGFLARGMTNSSPRMSRMVRPTDSVRAALRARLATLVCEYQRAWRSRAAAWRLAILVRSIAVLAGIEFDGARRSAHFLEMNHRTAEHCLASLWILVDVLDREQMPAPQVLAHAMDELLVLMVQAGPAAIGSHRIERQPLAGH